MSQNLRNPTLESLLEILDTTEHCLKFIFEKIAGKTPAILLQYEPLADLLQKLNQTIKNTFFRGHLSVTASVYQAGA